MAGVELGSRSTRPAATEKLESNAMKPRVYVETTVVSYLTARRSRDLVVAAHQQITEDWWRDRRDDFDLYVSASVELEAAAGDQAAAARRLAAIEALDRLAITDEVEALASALIVAGMLPQKAAEDALHITIATVHGMDFLLTWNCRHIANAEIRRRLTGTMVEKGYVLPVICTPEELAGDS